MNGIAKLQQIALALRRDMEQIPWGKDIPTVWTPEHTISSIVPSLAKENFAVGWWISYDEGGTVINAMRPIEIADSGPLKGFQKQHHSRGRVVKKDGEVGIQWAPHTEAFAITNPDLHKKEIGLSHKQGQQKWVPVCKEIGITPTKMPAS